MNGTATSAFHVRYLRLSYGCGALLALILGLNFFFDVPRVLIPAIVAVFALYTWLGLFDAEGNADLLTKYGETGYFLGYLTTIAALVCLAFQIQHNPKTLEEIDTLLRKGGFAIVSTVAGLFGMFLFRVATHAQDPGKPGRESEAGTARGVLEETSRFSEQVDEIMEVLRKKSVEVFSAFDQTLGQFGTAQAKAMGEVFGKVEGLAGSVSKLTESIEQGALHIAELHKSSLSAAASLAAVAESTTTIKDAATKLDAVLYIGSIEHRPTNGHIWALTPLSAIRKQ